MRASQRNMVKLDYLLIFSISRKHIDLGPMFHFENFQKIELQCLQIFVNWKTKRSRNNLMFNIEVR